MRADQSGTDKAESGAREADADRSSSWNRTISPGKRTTLSGGASPLGPAESQALVGEIQRAARRHDATIVVTSLAGAKRFRAGDDVVVCAVQTRTRLATLARTALDKPRAGDAAHIESLGMMLGHSSARDYALHQLAQLGPAASDALPPVLALLEDDHPLIRYLAAEAIGEMGPAARHALAALQLHQDSDPIVRAAITEAMSTIESGSAAHAEPQTKERPR